LSEQLATLRLSRAKDFLLQTKLSATDIAAQVGFTTPQYFSNTFHKAFGVTPDASASVTSRLERQRALLE
jgi:transcriptional regulator GlxA family with amidase domain